MFKKIFDDKKPAEEQPAAAAEPAGVSSVLADSPAAPKRKAVALPLRFALLYPFQYGSEVVRELVCDRRPNMRTIRRIMSVSESDAAQEVIEIIFYDLLGVTPAQLDLIDAEDGLQVIEKIFEAFPFLKTGSASASETVDPTAARDPAQAI
jgi:hypothetical protein